MIVVQCWLMQGQELDEKTQPILWTKWPIGALVGVGSLCQALVFSMVLMLVLSLPNATRQHANLWKLVYPWPSSMSSWVSLLLRNDTSMYVKGRNFNIRIIQVHIKMWELAHKCKMTSSSHRECYVLGNLQEEPYYQM